MSDINKMDFKQLRNEVQLLRDELAIMKRKYEDIIYNLDDSNFSGQFIKEKNDMKTKIEVTADGIKTMGVNNATDEKLENYSTISQTAEEVRTRVAEEIGDLEYSVSEAIQTATGFETRVSDLENGEYGGYTLFRQTADTFLFEGKYMEISSAIKLTDNYGNHSFSIFHNEGSGDTIRGTYIGASGHNLTDPLFIGNSSQKVYLYDINDNNLIATRGWVLENAGSGGSGGVAVFG